MSSRIVELSSIIAENTKLIDNYFVKNGIPTPSFDISGPPRVSIPASEGQAHAAHIAILDATTELNQLLTGPSAMLMSISPNDSLSLQAVYHYQIAQALPVGEERSFEEIAQTISLDAINVRRLLRHAMCNRIFHEPRAGYVAHTAASKLLAEKQMVYNFSGISTEEKFPSAARTVDSLVNNSNNPGSQKTGFTLANNTDLSFYQFMEANPPRGNRWAAAMNTFASTVPTEGLCNTFDWASLGKATVVDVGGTWGAASIGLARSFPDLSFIVQDLPSVVAEGQARLPTQLKDRFKFMPHDFFTPQPVKGAAIYFFRAVFHEQPDDKCVEILRNHIPALKNGARLVINDSCLHQPGSLPATTEKKRREMDLNMLTYFGSREKTVADWEHILSEADSRFHLRSAKQPPNDTAWVLDVEWNV